LEAQDHQGDQDAITEDQAVVGSGTGGALAWVVTALLEGGLVGGGPGAGQLDGQVGKVLPGDPGEDRMGEGRTGPCWRRHPRMITRAARLMPAGDTSTARAQQQQDGRKLARSAVSAAACWGMTVALWTGLGLGFLVAAQVGPIWLLCARSVLRGRLTTGLAIGAGAALVDLAYACLGVAGAAQLLRVAPLRLALGLVGTAVLLALGTRTLWSAVRVRAGGETQGELASPLRALRVSLAATASNPLTIASWAAVFAAASAASVATNTATTSAMLAGIGVGSFAWFSILSLGMTALRRRIGDRGLRAADTLAGLGLLGFGGLLGWRTLRTA
jgi:threonine/homoserine/homoserine lactone efflux protein